MNLGSVRLELGPYFYDVGVEPGTYQLELNRPLLEFLLLRHDMLAYIRLDECLFNVGRFPMTKRGHSYYNIL